MRLDLSPAGDELRLHSEFRERDLVRQVPGVRWLKEAGQWAAPLSWGTAWAVRGIFGAGVDVSPEVAAWVAREFAVRGPLSELRISTTPPATDLDGDPVWERLGALQKVGAAYLADARTAIIADEMGSGKTVQTIQALRLLALRGSQPLPALLVVPNSMKFTWQAELSRWWPELPPERVSVALGSTATRRKAIARVAEGGADVLIINWESLWRHSRLEKYGSQAMTEKEKTPQELNSVTWRAVVADEAHRAASPNAKQTRALWAVGDPATYRFALTGTPVEKSPDQLWPQLRFVSPADWPGKTKFVDRYCAQGFSLYGLNVIGLRPDTADEFWQVASGQLIRRPKAAILPQLPPKRRQTRLVEMEAKQAKAYRQLQETSVALLDTGALVATDPLTVATRLSQLASAYAEFDADGRPALALPSCKVTALLEIVNEAGEMPLAVFAESKQLLYLAAGKLKTARVSHALYTGDQSPFEREEAKRLYLEGHAQVLLLTYGVGAEGITLTAGNTAVFLQRSWSSIKNSQAEDRVHRPGAEQFGEVLLIDVVARGTIDEARLELLGEKEDRVAEVLRDADTLHRLLTNEREPL